MDLLPRINESDIFPELVEKTNVAITAIETTDSRIDNLVSINNPTQGNSELLDIRVGVDSTIYNSAGNSVRAQIVQVKKETLAAIQKGAFDLEFDENNSHLYIIDFWGNRVGLGTHISAGVDGLSMKVVPQGDVNYLVTKDSNGKELCRVIISTAGGSGGVDDVILANLSEEVTTARSGKPNLKAQLDFIQDTIPPNSQSITNQEIEDICQ